MPSQITTLLFCHLLYGLLCAILARKRNRSGWLWFGLSVPLGPIALFLLLALPAATTGAGPRALTDRRP